MEKNMNCIVPTKSALFALKNHEQGECVFCEEDNKIYIWKEDKWETVDIENQGLSMNLYELNKTVVNQLPVLSKSEIAGKMGILEELHRETMNTHYMLLCKEYNYYTIFECDSMMNMPTFGAAVCEIVSNLGDVYDIDWAEDHGAIEIWARPNGEESALAFYLFAYDAGVVYYG
jgi:hypothetical protein